MKKRPFIMVVDDDEEIRKILSSMLELEDYNVVVASGGNQALAMLEEHRLDLILLDIMMPGKSGAELLPEVIARYPDIAVIMITAITDPSAAVNCMKKGAYDYIIKPFNLNEVNRKVAQTLERRELKLKVRRYQQSLELKVKHRTREIRDFFFNSITSLVYALEAKDSYTSRHSQKVTEISVAIARKMGLSEARIEKIRFGGLVHDVGKIGVKESVLNKPGILTQKEYQQIKLHPEIGGRILGPIDTDREILQIVRHHHENYDGSGYPDGLSGNQIPLGARIVAVADAYDAMTSNRPHRGAIGFEKVRIEIKRCRTSQFDPEVADALLAICENSIISSAHAVTCPPKTGPSRVRLLWGNHTTIGGSHEKVRVRLLWCNHKTIGGYHEKVTVH